jgi:hypothetical protein
MDILILIVAWLSMVLTLINTICMPLAFGIERKPYSYGTFLASIFTLVVVWLLALKALGYL